MVTKPRKEPPKSDDAYHPDVTVAYYIRWVHASAVWDIPRPSVKYENLDTIPTTQL
jgi:hypothetical protein